MRGNRFNPAPGWPAPPPGWVPGPGWQPDPSWPAAPPGWSFWVTDGWALDGAVDQIRDNRWPVRLAAVPVLVIIAALGLELLTFHLWHPTGVAHTVAFGIGSVLHYAAAVVAIVLLGRPIAARCGGWSAAFGWGRPRRLDPLYGVGAAAGEFVARIIAGIVIAVAVPAVRGVSADNIDLHHRTTAEIVVIALVAVLVAPPIEELIFRGLLLRTAMRRWGFWPAALLSSVCFAVLHLYEVDGTAIPLLFVAIFVFGLGQCLLVRWTGRLAPAIAAHAVTNAAGVALSLLITR